MVNIMLRVIHVNDQPISARWPLKNSATFSCPHTQSYDENKRERRAMPQIMPVIDLNFPRVTLW